METAPAQAADFAQVETTDGGAPRAFVWRDRRFVVVTKPIPWIEKIRWWETASRAGRGQATVTERAMWQVQARADDGQILIFDLAVENSRHWPVTGIYD